MSVKLMVQEYAIRGQVSNQESILKFTRHACLERMVKHLAMHDLTPHGVFMHNLNIMLVPYHGHACVKNLNITFEFDTEEDLTQFVLAWS